MHIGNLWIGRPHRPAHWWSGICLEWGDRGFRPPYRPHVHFVRVYLQ